MVLQIFLYRKAASWPTVIVGNEYNVPNVNHCISAPYRAGVIESSSRRLRWPSNRYILVTAVSTNEMKSKRRRRSGVLAQAAGSLSPRVAVAQQ